MTGGALAFGRSLRTTFPSMGTTPTAAVPYLNGPVYHVEEAEGETVGLGEGEGER